MWGGPQKVFLKYEFQLGRFANFGTPGGQKSPLPIDKILAYISAWSHRSRVINNSSVASYMEHWAPPRPSTFNGFIFRSPQSHRNSDIEEYVVTDP